MRILVDLMQTQKQLGHDVFAIYPGNPSLFSRKFSIYNEGFSFNIPNYKIKHALLLPLFHGIKNTRPFMAEKFDGFDVFSDFFKSNQFDVLHVHTLMGLPVSFLIAAKENGVRIVYTSHDYYGLCPKVNFINQNGILCNGAFPERCEKCNEYAKPLLYLWLRNSRLLVILKKIMKR